MPADWPDHNWVYAYGPAGGINSNILDMTKWLRLQLGKGKFNGEQLISEANLQFLHTPKTIMGTDPSKMAYYCEAWLYQPFRPSPSSGTTAAPPATRPWWPSCLGPVSASWCFPT